MLMSFTAVYRIVYTTLRPQTDNCCQFNSYYNVKLTCGDMLESALELFVDNTPSETHNTDQLNLVLYIYIFYVMKEVRANNRMVRLRYSMMIGLILFGILCGVVTASEDLKRTVSGLSIIHHASSICGQAFSIYIALGFDFLVRGNSRELCRIFIIFVCLCYCGCP